MNDKDRELVLGLPRARIIGARPWKGILSEGIDGHLDLIAREAEYRPRGEAVGRTHGVVPRSFEVLFDELDAERIVVND